MVIALSPPMLCENHSLSVSSDAPLVLIADDDDLIRLVLRQAMEDEGYQVAEARNGQECIDQYAALQPTIVLLDGKMPLIDGFTCCATLHQRYGDATAPIVMVTSLDHADAIKQAFSMGVSDYITKPFNWAVLSQRIRRLLQGLELKKQLQSVHDTVESCVQKRMTNLPTALDSAVVLNQITARIHDSLEESNIVHTVVQELAKAIPETHSTSVVIDDHSPVIYAPSGGTSLIADPDTLIAYLNQQAEISHQIAQGQLVHFCTVAPDASQARISVLACPISSAETTVGTLWLTKADHQIFTEQEIQLMQQVASHCAIAIRNARLHHACQNRVQELEQLNQRNDEFLSAVVHELRSPLANMQLATHTLERILNSVQTLPEAIAKDAPDFSKSLLCLKILDSECEKELSLIRDLFELQQLDLKTEGWSEPVPVPLRDWILNIAETFEERTKLQGQTLRLAIAPHLPDFLLTNPKSLERLLRELITNACKYSPLGETITISVHSDAQMLHLNILNSGVEIPESEFSRIFTRFYRIPNSDHRQQGGSGLGLELVKRLVETLNGSIEVESNNSQCCFTVKLPL